jgi:hypothetical protein
MVGWSVEEKDGMRSWERKQSAGVFRGKAWDEELR